MYLAANNCRVLTSRKHFIAVTPKEKPWQASNMLPLEKGCSVKENRNVTLTVQLF